MSAGSQRARMTVLAALSGSACNGQFDFDTGLLDAGDPPVIVVEAGPVDASLLTDSAADVPKTGVHIACSDSECMTSGCCSKTSGTSCIDTAEGGICGGILIQCDDTDDCSAGQVCCAEGEHLDRPPCTGDACDDRPRLLRVHCEPEARCRGEFVPLCNPDRPYPCAQCVASSLPGLPPGYHQCATAP